MFVDVADIFVEGGDGGNGAVSVSQGKIRFAGGRSGRRRRRKRRKRYFRG